MLAAGARPKDTKINLMACIFLCSEVEIAVQVVVRKVNFCFSSLLADLNLRLHARNLDIARNWCAFKYCTRLWRYIYHKMQ